MTQRSAVRLALAAALALGPVAAAAAPQSSTSLPALDSPGNYHIATDLIQSNIVTGDFTMPHKVRFTRPGTDGTADSAHGNSKQGVVTLSGDVVIHDTGSAPEAAGAGAAAKGPSTIWCDQLVVDSHARTYTATGHVRFEQAGSRGTADRAVLDRATNTLQLEGNVTLSSGGSSMSSSTLNYNLSTKDVVSKGSPLTLRQPLASPPPPAKPHPAKKP